MLNIVRKIGFEPAAPVPESFEMSAFVPMQKRPYHLTLLS